MTPDRKRKIDVSEAFRPLFGQEIARLREESKLSQEKLARLAGMDPGTLRRLEKGKSPIREDYLTGLCDALEIGPGDLLRRVILPYERALAESQPADAEGPLRELFRKVREKFENRVRSDRELLDALLEVAHYFDAQR